MQSSNQRKPDPLRFQYRSAYVRQSIFLHYLSILHLQCTSDALSSTLIMLFFQLHYSLLIRQYKVEATTKKKPTIWLAVKSSVVTDMLNPPTSWEVLLAYLTQSGLCSIPYAKTPYIMTDKREQNTTVKFAFLSFFMLLLRIAPPTIRGAI